MRWIPPLLTSAGDGLHLEFIKVSTVRLRSTMQKYTSGAFYNLEFHSYNFVTVTYIGDTVFLLPIVGGTVLRTIRGDWVKFHGEKHEESRGKKHPTLLAHLTCYECTVGSDNFSLKPTYLVLGFFLSSQHRQHEPVFMCPSSGKGWCHLPLHQGRCFQQMEMSCSG